MTSPFVAHNRVWMIGGLSVVTRVFCDLSQLEYVLEITYTINVNFSGVHKTFETLLNIDYIKEIQIVSYKRMHVCHLANT